MLLQQAEMGLRPAPRAAMGLRVSAAVQAPSRAGQQPERQARALELWALLELRQADPLEQDAWLARPKPA
jgi:hypothetical protein